MSDEQSAPVCYRHRNRETYLSCSRCGKPICADCRIDAPVGFHCPDCVAQGRRTTRQARTSFGGVAGSGSAGTVTKVLIVLNVAVFILAALSTGSLMGLTTTSMTPLHVIGAEIGYYGGYDALRTDLFGIEVTAPVIAAGGYYRMITSMFLHYGAFHLLLNMVVLWLFGRVLEHDLGPARFLAVYLLSGLAGSVAVYYFAPETATAGASGAVYGLFGLLVMVNRKLKRDNRSIYVLIALNLVLTLVIGFSFWGHVGGLVGGLICGAILTFIPRERRNLHWAGFAAFLAILAVATILQTAALEGRSGVI